MILNVRQKIKHITDIINECGNEYINDQSDR